MKKLDYIDGLKGIGALMVFFCHFVFAFYYAAYSLTEDAVNTASGIEIAIGRTPLNLLYSGNTAVCLFLVFSGFVLCLSYFRTRDKKRLKAAAWKRYFRLMPMILMVNMAIFILMSLGLYRNDEAAILTKSTVWFAGFNQFQPNALQMLGESLVGCFLFGSNDYNGVLWTMPYLFSGALVVYLAAYLVGENPFRYVAYGVMLLVAVKTDVYFSGIFLGFAAADFFCTREKGMELWKRWWALPMGSFVLGLYLLSYPSIGADMSGTIYGVLPPAYTTIYHLAGAALLLAGVLGLPGLQRFFGAKPFRFLGKISYSLYLLHFPVIATFSCWLFLSLYGKMSYGLLTSLNFVCTLALTLALSALSQKYLEPVSGRLIHGISNLFTGHKKG